jgi:hypothetical protein
MSAPVIVTVAVLVLAIGVGVGWWLPPHGWRPRRDRPAPVRQILLPFTGLTLSRRAVDAAVRLAVVENATLMPAYLACVPLHLPLDAALPRQCGLAMPVLEAIERRAAGQGVAVDSRIARGRSYRDALRHLLESERFDRVVVPATATARTGLSGDDLVWLLERAPAEVVILRPDPEDKLALAADGVAAHA